VKDFDRHSQNERSNKSRNVLKREWNRELKRKTCIEIDKGPTEMIWRGSEDLCWIATESRKCQLKWQGCNKPKFEDCIE
jgi:hypothetical protein